MTRQLPVRVSYEYLARPRKHQIPCPHRQGVGHGAFAFQERVRLWQGVTHTTLYQSRVPRVLRPLESLLTSPVGDVDSPHRRKLSQRRAPAVCGEEKALLRKCNNSTMTLSSLRPAKCSGLSEGKWLYRVRFGQIAAYGRLVRMYAVKRPNSRIYGWSFDHECGILHLENQLRQI